MKIKYIDTVFSNILSIMDTNEFVEKCINYIKNIDIKERMLECWLEGCSGFEVFDKPQFSLITQNQRKQILDALHEKINACELYNGKLDVHTGDNGIIVCYHR
jgi:hypothetical protein